jgi:hypothetical protein
VTPDERSDQTPDPRHADLKTIGASKAGADRGWNRGFRTDLLVAIPEASFTARGPVARLAGLGFADAQGAAVMLLTVECLDGCLTLGRIGHGDETEAATAAGVSVHDDLGAGDGAVGREKGGQALIVDGPGKIADVEFHE